MAQFEQRFNAPDTGALWGFQELARGLSNIPKHLRWAGQNNALTPEMLQAVAQQQPEPAPIPTPDMRFSQRFNPDGHAPPGMGFSQRFNPEPGLPNTAIPQSAIQGAPNAQQMAQQTPVQPQQRAQVPVPSQLPSQQPQAGAQPGMQQQPGFGGKITNWLRDNPAQVWTLAGGLMDGNLGNAMSRMPGAIDADKKSGEGETTNGLTEYRRAVEQGYQGSWMDYKRDMANMKKVASQTVNVGGGKYGPIPAGYRLRDTPEGAIMEPVSGSPAEKELLAGEQAAAARADTGAKSSDIVLSSINHAKTIFEGNPEFTTGFGGAIMLKMPGSDAIDLQEAIAPIEASIAFDRLQKMRDESPTGGALGQVSERELALLAATIASLKQSQSADSFRYNVNKVETVYKDIARKFAAYPNAETYGFAQQGNGTQSVGGTNPLKKKYGLE